MKDALVASAHGSGGSLRCGGSGSPTVSACPQLADPRRAAGSSPHHRPWPLDVARGGPRHQRSQGRHCHQQCRLPTAASRPGSLSPSTDRVSMLRARRNSPLPGRGFVPLCRGLGAAGTTPALAPAARELAIPVCRSHVCAEPCASFLPKSDRFGQPLFFSKIKPFSEKNSKNFWL